MSVKNRVQPLQISRVEVVFSLFLLICGLPLIVLIPPGAGYDEEDHLVRVWELSSLSLIPGQMPPQEMQYPLVFRDFAYRQQGSSGVLGSEFWQKYSGASLYKDGIVRRELDTKSVYSPVLLLPQAIVMRLLERGADTPALFLFYACRLASLLSYLFLAWMAIRLIPFGKWILMVLALAPMALFQAATVSPDAISNGIGFLFIAGSLRTAEQREIRWKEMGILALLVFLLFLAKLNLIPLVLLPFLLIPPSRFHGRYTYIVLVVLTFFLFIFEVAGWNLIAAARSSPLLANDANPSAQLTHVLSSPLSFLLAMIKDVWANGWIYLQGWINGYGYYYWTPPALVSLLFILSLAAALWTDPTRERIPGKYRWSFVLVFVAGYLATIASLYLTFTPVGSDQIFGVQGRYFIPLALLLFLAVPGIRRDSRKFESFYKWTGGFLLAALSLNVIAAYLSFHVPCGAMYYSTGLCYRPLFREFPGDVRPSPPMNGVSLEQEIGVTCDGFSEVRVWLSPSTPAGQGSTRFVLREVRSNRVVLDTSIANHAFPTEDWYRISFEPDWTSAGKQYVLKILGPDALSGQAPQVLYTAHPEFDLGDLSENGQLLEEDIVLQHGCVTGLRKIWLTGTP